MYIYICTNIYIYIHMHIFISTYVDMYIYKYIYICACVCVCSCKSLLNTKYFWSPLDHHPMWGWGENNTQLFQEPRNKTFSAQRMRKRLKRSKGLMKNTQLQNCVKHHTVSFLAEWQDKGMVLWGLLILLVGNHGAGSHMPNVKLQYSRTEVQ